MATCPARIAHIPFREQPIMLRCRLTLGHGGDFHETEFRGEDITWPTRPPVLDREPTPRPRPASAPPDPRTREEREAERQFVFDNPRVNFPFEFEDAE
jgi:hypothetical protein